MSFEWRQIYMCFFTVTASTFDRLFLESWTESLFVFLFCSFIVMHLNVWLSCRRDSDHRNSSLETRKQHQFWIIAHVLDSFLEKVCMWLIFVCLCLCVLNCSPSSLDAYVFAHLAPLLKIKLPNGKLQQHLNSLNNLEQFCSNILLLYFPSDQRGGYYVKRFCYILLLKVQ